MVMSDYIQFQKVSINTKWELAEIISPRLMVKNAENATLSNLVE